MNWLDRLTAPLAPRWTLQRQRARVAAELMLRHFEAASTGRRTQGWRRSSADANAAAGAGRDLLREHARDLIRNNPWALNALSTIVDHTIGWGIAASSTDTRALSAWKAWAETTACDADGRQDLAGLEKQVLRTVVESGEVLVRRRWRLPKDKLPIPLQLQVLEPDYLDASKDSLNVGRDATGRMIQGVQFDALGRREGYWLFDDHPGASISRLGASRFIPASEILHIYRSERPGQVRGVSWLAPVTLRLKEFDEYEDASLVKQKIAACLAVFTTDADGSSTPLGIAGAGAAGQPETDQLYPGMIVNAASGRDISVVQPPQVTEYSVYAQTVLRAIAAGLGIAYEDLTGDYTATNFSSARMARLRTWARVEDWRWRLMVPQFCAPIWGWAMQAAAIAGGVEARQWVHRVPDVARRAPVAAEAALNDVHWTAPPMPMLEPDKEGLAYARNVRAGIITLYEAIRERGYDPEIFLREYAEGNAAIDKLKIILDSDARRTTQQGMHSGQPDYQDPATTPAAANAQRDRLIDALLATLTSQPARAPANGNGHDHGREGLEEMRRWLDARLMLAERAPDVHVYPPAAPAPNIDARTEVHVAPSPVTVGAPVVNVAPAEVNVAEGAIRVEVAPAPAPNVTIEEGAIRVDSPVTVTPPTPPQITVVRSPSRPKEPRDE